MTRWVLLWLAVVCILLALVSLCSPYDRRIGMELTYWVSTICLMVAAGILLALAHYAR